MYNNFNLFSYTQVIDGKSSLVVDVELPGVDPSNVKLSYNKQTVWLNTTPVVRVGENYDLAQAKAELKHGLLKIIVPVDSKHVGEIPLTVG